MADDHGSSARRREHLDHLATLGSIVSAHAARTSVPCIVGVGGTVAVGKSTLAVELADRLHAHAGHRVEIVSTDGFLFPNAHLDALGLTFAKGAPHTYDLAAIAEFVAAARRGDTDVAVPSYSHLTYDVDPTAGRLLAPSDVVIVEGLDVVTVDRGVLDLVDLSIVVVADPADNERWFVDRFMRLRAEAADEPGSFFHQFVAFDDETARAVAEWTWNEMNQPVALAHVLPARDSADVTVVLDGAHLIESLTVRPSDGISLAGQ